MAIVINGDGNLTGLTAGGLPNASITQSDLAAGVAGNGPAFSATMSGNQSVTTSTYTQVQFSTEDFDTASRYNNTGATVGGIPAYSFLPNVEGYYQISASVYPNTTVTGINCAIYKNNVIFRVNGGTTTSAEISLLMYLNGSTDYISIFGFLVGTTPAINGGVTASYFTAAMVRAA